MSLLTKPSSVALTTLQRHLLSVEHKDLFLGKGCVHNYHFPKNSEYKDCKCGLVVNNKYTTLEERKKLQREKKKEKALDISRQPRFTDVRVPTAWATSPRRQDWRSYWQDGTTATFSSDYIIYTDSNTTQ